MEVGDSSPGPMPEAGADKAGPHAESRERSRRVARNVVFSLAIKGGAAALSYMTVPIALSVLSKADYGVWLTLSSMVTWFTFFDLGLTNGLRNRLAEALARDDTELARKLVSTCLAVISLIAAGLFVVYLIATPFVDWAAVLNASPLRRAELRSTATLMVGGFGLSFVLNTVGVVFMASQRPALNDLVVFLGQLLSFATLWLIAHVRADAATLTSVSAALSLPPAMATGAAFVVAFAGHYRQIRPSISSVRFGLARSFLGLGSRFLLVRLSSIAIFSLSVVMVTQMVGPEAATEFGLARKYFRVVSIVATVATMPVWAATTEAFVVGDVDWVRRILRRLLLLFGVAVVGIAAMTVAANWVYGIWLGPSVTIAFPLTLACAAFAVLDAWNSVFAFIVAGSGKMKLTSIYAVVSVVTFLPFSLVLGRLLGSVGIAVATCVAVLFWAVQLPMQTRKLLDGTVGGVWAQ